MSVLSLNVCICLLGCTAYIHPFLHPHTLQVLLRWPIYIYIRMYVYVCVYTCMYTYMCVHVYIYIHTYICVYAYIYVNIKICVYFHLHETSDGTWNHLPERFICSALFYEWMYDELFIMDYGLFYISIYYVCIP